MQSRCLLAKSFAATIPHTLLLVKRHRVIVFIFLPVRIRAAAVAIQWWPFLCQEAEARFTCHGMSFLPLAPPVLLLCCGGHVVCIQRSALWDSKHLIFHSTDGEIFVPMWTNNVSNTWLGKVDSTIDACREASLVEWVFQNRILIYASQFHTGGTGLLNLVP